MLDRDQRRLIMMDKERSRDIEASSVTNAKQRDVQAEAKRESDAAINAGPADISAGREVSFSEARARLGPIGE
ncbi:MAG: hypothetical protein J4F45_13065 [Pseudomonadales bacterium]|nr:hypothetical protein [Pseudomonadales bacterium]